MSFLVNTTNITNWFHGVDQSISQWLSITFIHFPCFPTQWCYLGLILISLLITNNFPGKCADPLQGKRCLNLCDCVPIDTCAWRWSIWWDIMGGGGGTGNDSAPAFNREENTNVCTVFKKIPLLAIWLLECDACSLTSFQNSPRIMLLTNSSFALADAKSPQVKTTIKVNEIKGISMSGCRDGLFVLHLAEVSRDVICTYQKYFCMNDTEIRHH